MVWPGVGLLLSIALYAAVAFIGSQTTVPSGDLFAEVGPVQIVFNILVFVVGALSVAFGPISFFIGLVLLIVRLGRKNKQQSQRETAAKE